MFYKLKDSPIIINDLDNNTEESRDVIRQLIVSRFSTDMVSLIPSCFCGQKKGQALTRDETVCEVCGTKVTSSIEDDIEPLVWFRRPGINDEQPISKLISPIVWIMLKHRFTKSGFNIIQWLCDTTYRTNVRQPKVVSKIVEAGIQRGYNNFVDNFDLIMSFLFNLKDFKVKKTKDDYLPIFLEQNRHKLFSDYIPLPNKSLLIIEKTDVGVYVDPIIIGAIDAIDMLVSIDNRFYDQNPKTKANRMVKALSKLCLYYENFYRFNLAVKSGQFRKHIYGGRSNFSFRAVISSLTGPHEYDEIHVPWGIGLTAFRPHLVNKLLKLGMDLNSIIGLLLGNIERYHPLLDRLLKELIAESPLGKIPIALQRNPSLMQGSIQRVYITKFKSDPTDTTISIPILICKAFNADFDGDALNCTIATDNKMAAWLYSLAPEFNIYHLDFPDKISGNIGISKPVIAAHSAWLNSV